MQVRFSIILDFWSRFAENPGIEEPDANCFLGWSQLQTLLFSQNNLSKRVRNNKKLKRKTRAFQNFKDHEKILIIKKVTGI